MIRRIKKHPALTKELEHSYGMQFYEKLAKKAKEKNIGFYLRQLERPAHQMKVAS